MTRVAELGEVTMVARVTRAGACSCVVTPSPELLSLAGYMPQSKSAAVAITGRDARPTESDGVWRGTLHASRVI